jgi:hypothetical protein
MSTMRVIIAESRTFTDYYQMCKDLAIIFRKHWPDVIISGTAQGADRLGERWAREHGVTLECYPADWDKHGRSAGYRRNELMATIATHCIVFWDGESRGSKHMADLARKNGLHLRVLTPGVSSPSSGIIPMTGDLFTSKCGVLVNTCNCVGAMGAGIALAMRGRYPIMYEQYRLACSDRHAGQRILNPGDNWWWEGPSGIRICNMMVKDDWRKPSNMGWIESCLHLLRKTIDNSDGGIQSVALPRIGAGNGQLPWPPIEKLIHKTLGDLSIRVELWTFAESKK